MSQQCEKRGRPFLKAYNPEKHMVVFFRPRCKTWSCPACAAINTKLWAARTHYAANEIQEQGEGLQFLTLTSHEKLDGYTSLKVWPKAWKKLHTRANRAGGHGAYLMVPERHKDGRLHMHALVTWDMKSSWWKDNGRACGLGFMNEVEPVRTAGGAATYVTKYLMKSLEDAFWPDGWRRVRLSRDWPKMPDVERPAGWRFSALEKQDKLSEEIMRHMVGMDRVLVLDHITAWEAIGAIDNEGEFMP
jgi:hypothetical protein